jgi:hypothetical protein
MKTFLSVCFLIMPLVFCNSCTTGVDASPEPGVFRVTIVSNDADSILVILGDTARCSRVDRYTVTTSKGRLYQGSFYVDLYAEPTIDRIPSTTINLLQRQWPDGRLVDGTDPFEIPRWKTSPVRYTVFEWYTPPGTYDKFEFGLSGSEVFVAIPRQFDNPLQLPDGVSSIMDFPRSITVNAGKVTQVDIAIDPYKSIQRYRDTYLFDRKVSIVQVQNF